MPTEISENIIEPGTAGDLEQIAHALLSAEKLVEERTAAEAAVAAILTQRQDEARRARYALSTLKKRLHDLHHVSHGKCAWRMNEGLSRDQPLKPCPRKATTGPEKRFCEVHALFAERELSRATSAARSLARGVR
jgi:hypothetical protein